MLRVPRRSESRAQASQAVAGEHDLDRGGVAPQLRYCLPTCNSRGSSFKHTAAASALARSWGGCIPFRGKAVRVTERSGLEDAGGLGPRPESKVIIFCGSLPKLKVVL